MASKIKVNKEIFEREDSTSFYLLGCFLSDGNVHYTRSRNGNKCPYYVNSFSSNDIEWIETITELLSPGRPLYKMKNQDYYRLQMIDVDLSNWLIKWGCVPRKSLTLKFPNKIPDKYLPDLIRGVFDGDGSVGIYPYTIQKNGKIYRYKKVQCYICSASRIFINSLGKILDKLGINYQVVIDDKRNKRSYIRGREIKGGILYRILFQSYGDAFGFINFIYYPGFKHCMQRKYIIAMKAIKLINSRPGQGWNKITKTSVTSGTLRLGRRSRGAKPRS